MTTCNGVAVQVRSHSKRTGNGVFQFGQVWHPRFSMLV